jgi:acyl transferase domain-containing protein
MYTRRGAFLDRVDTFDPQFFGIAPREAVSLDPQQRLLLEVSWEALERAGLAPDRLMGTQTGVFIGISSSEYALLQTRELETPDLYFGTGSALSAAAGRLSYVLGLQGPSLSVDTACSSSLVAVHLAVQSLRRGECGVALAGGVNVLLAPDITVTFCRARMMARDGRCKTFDASADGYVRGEGCGIVVLKRLSDAVADGDSILAVIRGTAVNQDGRSSGLTVPNGPAQQALLRAALDDADVNAEDIQYVEAHGTGTPLGDPIEVQALASVFGKDRPSDQPLLLGSVKTNIGHLEAAAGVAGLIKVVLALQHGEIPAHLHFRTPNPNIAWSELPVSVATATQPWPARGTRRMAGVSSFGFTGTNAHVVLEAPPEVPVPGTSSDRSRHVLALSARSEQALVELAASYGTWLESADEDALGDLCFTANSGRSHFSHRAAFTAASSSELRASLAAFAPSDVSPAWIGGRFEGLAPKWRGCSQARARRRRNGPRVV